jgi:hypothetical protein
MRVHGAVLEFAASKTVTKNCLLYPMRIAYYMSYKRLRNTNLIICSLLKNADNTFAATLAI